MSHFSYRNGVLHAEDMPLPALAAQFGTPTYVYSKAALLENYGAYANACRAHGRGEETRWCAIRSSPIPTWRC